MNEFDEALATTPGRTRSERHIENIRQGGGPFVEAVRLTRMPMIVTDATLPGNPITFANQAFVELSGYAMDELLGQDPHFMNGDATDPEAIRQYEDSIRRGDDANLELVQYRKDGTPFWAALFASPLEDGQGTVVGQFLSYFDVTRRHEAERSLRANAAELERRVAERTRELEAANERLEALVAERDMLVVEVNHRAKNSLAVASSLLHVQTRRQSDPAIAALFREAQDHLGAMARVHDLLSRSENGQRVNIATYVTDLCEPLSALTGTDQRIRLVAEAADDILVAADTAFPLGIALTELITNAVKYAFPAPRSGTILVKAQRDQSGRVAIVVEDDGVGMSSPREGSLGYELVKSLVRQIKGDIAIVSEKGLTVTISFLA
jgi:PAS domain S-box-containing protein